MPRKKRKFNEMITLGFTAEGKRIRKYISADSKTEFERMKKEAILEADKIRNPSGVLFGKYAEKWYQTYKAGKMTQTKNQYYYAKKKLQPLNSIPFRDVTVSDLQLIINQNADHPRSCQILRNTIRQIYAQAIRDGIVYPMNPADALELPQYVCKEQRFITDAEMKKIEKCALQPQDGLYMDMLRNTGMRPSEALALQWSDIDTANLEITVRRTFEFDGNDPKVKPPKTGKVRVVPIVDDFAARLQDSPRNGLFVFTYGNGQPMTKSVYRKMSARILKGINKALGGTDDLNVLDGMRMYSFRHTYATNLYYKAVVPGIISAKMAATILGNSEEVFLQRYAHLDGDREKMTDLRNALKGKNDKKGDIRNTLHPENSPRGTLGTHII